MKVARAGVDIGVDTSAASKRTTTQQSHRIRAANNRAKRVARLVKRWTKTRRLAMTGAKPAQTYGHTAIGMAPTQLRACKRNIAESTGLQAAGACSTSRYRTLQHVHSRPTGRDAE